MVRIRIKRMNVHVCIIIQDNIFMSQANNKNNFAHLYGWYFTRCVVNCGQAFPFAHFYTFQPPKPYPYVLICIIATRMYLILVVRCIQLWRYVPTINLSQWISRFCKTIASRAVSKLNVSFETNFIQM